jgi:glycosyltransferase involved in cell wall biosynthesis
MRGMNKPAIVHIGKYYPPVKGGMETSLKMLAERCADAFSLSVLVANTAMRTRREQIRGIRITRMARFGSLFSQPLTPAIFGYMRRMRADIIHIHLPNPLAAFAYLVVRPRGTLIVSYHAEIRKQRFFSFLYRPIVGALLARAAAVVITSQNLIEISPVLPRFRGKCVVIPHGVELARFELTPAIAARAAAIRERAAKPVILFVGRLVYYKGLSYLLRAMNDLDAMLVIVGEGPLGPRLKILAKRWGIADRVWWAGEIPDSELPAYFHASELFVLPSSEISETFSLAILEAFACAKPVVSTDLPTGVSFVNQDGCTGMIVQPKNHQALGRAIRKLLAGGRLREELGRNARKRAEEEFTAEKMGDKFISLYRAITKRD